MKISYNWLKQYIDFDWSPEELSDRLTMTGLEVEGLEKYESIPGGLEGVFVGEVKTCEAHPNADKLKICSVDVGREELLTIVCGAPNVAAGQKVPVATVGTMLHPVEGDPFQIKKSKIRGQASMGMICAEDELGLGKGHDGIIVLPGETPAGTPGHEVFDVEIDYVFEIGLTPNRVDAASHFGSARDIAALLRRPAQLPPAPAIDPATALENPFTIELPEPDRCARYVAIYIDGVTIQDAPEFIQDRLKAIGSRPINNVVDITNYVLHELGQPLHAFDADQLRGNKVVVKTLPEDIDFKTLDDTERKIRAGKDLMICDAEGPVAVAGVMGGQNSEVENHTTRVLLESAYFEPTGIRRTASHLGLKTDASFRFERGVDPNMALTAALRATALILEHAGGKASIVIDKQQQEFPPFEVQLDLAYARRLIGSDLGTDYIKEILEALEISVVGEADGKLELRVPPYRVDVQRPQDILEEILRIHGYNNLPLPTHNSLSLNLKQELDQNGLRERYFNSLAANGFYETVTCPLVPAHLAKDSTVRLANALNVEMAVLRENMLRTGLDIVEYNHRHKNFDLRLFEYGKSYHKLGEEYSERDWVVLFMTGASEPAHWADSSSGKKKQVKASSFYTLSREIERLQQLFGFSGQLRDIADHPSFAYGLELFRGERVIARFGRVHDNQLKGREVKGSVYYAEIEWGQVIRAYRKNKVKFKALPKFPSIQRDISMIVPDTVRYQAIQETIQKANPKLIREVSITDVYKGDRIEAGKKSYLLNLTLLDEKKTLTVKAADKVMSRVFHVLESGLGVEIRK